MPYAASISAQSSNLGEIQCDPATITGHGGSHAPTLVIPTTLALHPRPANQAVAITDVHAQVHVGPKRDQPVGPMTRARNTSSGAPWISNANYTATYAIDLRVPIPQEQMHALEMLPASSTDVPVRIQIEKRASAVGAEHQLPWGIGGGSALELWALSWIRTDELQFTVPGPHWAAQVLPGLGADRYRTVLIALPRDSPLTPDTPLVRWFDEARERHDRGDHRGCIERCRDVRKAVEAALAATRAEPVSTKAAQSGTLPQSATQFLDGVWKALAEITNNAHHPENGDGVFTHADARAVLLTTSTMLEYLAETIAPHRR